VYVAICSTCVTSMRSKALWRSAVLMPMPSFSMPATNSRWDTLINTHIHITHTHTHAHTHTRGVMCGMEIKQ